MLAKLSAHLDGIRVLLIRRNIAVRISTEALRHHLDEPSAINGNPMQTTLVPERGTLPSTSFLNGIPAGERLHELPPDISFDGPGMCGKERLFTALLNLFTQVLKALSQPGVIEYESLAKTA